MRRSAPGRLVDVGGFRLHLNATGHNGVTVVFDAALGATSLSWVYVQPEVSAFARACSYDRAGFGWSDAGPMPRTAGRIADELHTLLAAAQEPPPYLLVGHSFGGLVMRIFAARHPDLTAGLVLVDPAHPEDWTHPAPKEQIRIDRGVDLCRLGERAARFGIARLVSTLVGWGAIGPARAVADAFTGGRIALDTSWLLAPLWKLPPGVRGQMREFWVRPKFYEALGSQIASISTSAIETLDAGTRGYGDLPLVTISSTNPGEYRVRQQDALAALSSRGRHLIASNSTHWVPLDQPALVTAVIRHMHDAIRV